MLRRRLQGLGRRLLDDARLPCRQVSGAGVLHHGAVRPAFGEFLAWKWFGDGNKLRDEIYAKHDLIAFDCFCIGPETSGWFRKEIKSLDELKGLKMRFFGLGAKVMQKLGVSTQLLAAGRHLPGARARRDRRHRVLDAGDGHQARLPPVAKFNYFPGWHQQVSCTEILMNKKAFNALPESVQEDDRDRGAGTR